MFFVAPAQPAIKVELAFLGVIVVLGGTICGFSAGILIDEVLED
jgi:hypothetical protein